jgi:surface carbohydrate biosynthesis protein (TIGR04326 family)
MNEHKQPTLLWARDAPPPSCTPVLLWNSFGYESQHLHTISLPRFIEENAGAIRSRLLSFLCDARFVSHEGATLEEALNTSVGLSTWWLSFPSLKQWGKRQTIPIACRLIAVEMIVGSEFLGNVEVESDDENLSELINKVLQQSTVIKPSAELRYILRRRVHHPMRAILSLSRYKFQLRTLPRSSPVRSNSVHPNFAFFDYFSATNQTGSNDSRYVSPYWGTVPSEFSNPSWFHIYPNNVERRGVNHAVEHLARSEASTMNSHRLFLKNIESNDLIQLLVTYFKQLRTHARFQTKLRNFQLTGSRIRLWHIFEEEWNESILGSTAIRHLILLLTTDSLVKEMPKFDRVYFLFENQPWELALIHSVKKYGKGELVGVAHSTIRYWDLRYFMDPRENSLISPSSRRPLPNRIFTNGKIGTSLLEQNGYPDTCLTMVEALRYSYLDLLRGSLKNSRPNVVLLGDFLEHANEVLIKVFRGAFDMLDAKPSVKVRSHPICPLKGSQLGDLSSAVSSLPLASLLETASVVVTTAASSSAAEAAALGIPTIVVLDARTLNYSPFRESKDVYVVENSLQLAELLRSSSQLKANLSDDIFCIDKDYPRWRSELLRA